MNEWEELAIFENVILCLNNLEELGIEIVSVFVLGRFDLSRPEETNVIASTKYTQDDVFLIQCKYELLRIVHVRHTVVDHFMNLHLSAHQVHNAYCGDHFVFEIMDGIDVLSIMSDSDDSPSHVQIIGTSPSRKTTNDL